MVQRVTPEEIAALLEEARERGVKNDVDELSAKTRTYQRTLAAHERAQREVIIELLRVLLGSARPTAIEKASPFKGAYIRQLRKKAGLPSDQRYVRTPPRAPEA